MRPERIDSANIIYCLKIKITKNRIKCENFAFFTKTLSTFKCKKMDQAFLWYNKNNRDETHTVSFVINGNLHFVGKQDGQV